MVTEADSPEQANLPPHGLSNTVFDASPLKSVILAR